jgi:tetratricopeptide (TPR) repeat protein
MPDPTRPTRFLLPPLLLLVPLVAGCGEGGSQAVAEGPAPTLPTQPDLVPPELMMVIDEHVAAVRAQPGDGNLHGALGLLYEANDMWPEARTALETARSLAPQEPLWHLHAALAQAGVGEVDLALASLQEGTRQHPGAAPLFMRLGDFHMQRGETAPAREAYRTAANLAPEAPEPLLGLGEVALTETDPLTALPPLQRAVQVDPDYRAARYLLGVTLQQLGRDAEAEVELAAGQGARKRPMPDAASRELSLMSFGRAMARRDSQQLLAESRAAEALELLQPLVDRFPGDARLRVNFALALLRLERAEEALAELAEAESIDPGLAMVPYNRAVACLRLGRAAEAVTHAERAIALQAQLTPAHLVRAKALLELGRLEEAGAAAEEALTMDARLAPAHEILGTVAEQRNRPEEAHAAFLRAADLAENDGRPWPGIFRYALRSRDLALAQRALAAVQRLDPNFAELPEMQRQLEAAR